MSADSARDTEPRKMLRKILLTTRRRRAGARQHATALSLNTFNIALIDIARSMMIHIDTAEHAAMTLPFSQSRGSLFTANVAARAQTLLAAMLYAARAFRLNIDAACVMRELPRGYERCTLEILLWPLRESYRPIIMHFGFSLFRFWYWRWLRGWVTTFLLLLCLMRVKRRYLTTHFEHSRALLQPVYMVSLPGCVAPLSLILSPPPATIRPPPVSLMLLIYYLR